MPAQSKQQLKLIYAIRGKYKTKKTTPKKWKWVWGEEWGHLKKESHIVSFQKFNESYGTLTKDDMIFIDDLCVSLTDDWNLRTEINGPVYSGSEPHDGFLNLQMFDKFHIQFGIQLYQRFDWKKKGESFQKDLRQLINRIKRFDYEVREFAWNSEFHGTRTWSFQISHTDKRSEELFKSKPTEH